MARKNETIEILYKEYSDLVSQAAAFTVIKAYFKENHRIVSENMLAALIEEVEKEVREH